MMVIIKHNDSKNTYCGYFFPLQLMMSMIIIITTMIIHILTVMGFENLDMGCHRSLHINHHNEAGPRPLAVG